MTDTEVIIVGAGMAGALLAAKLAAAGRAVVVLDLGRAWTQADMPSSQVWARRHRWDGSAIESAGPDPVAFRAQSGTGLGGSGTHHYAQWPRLKPEDFQTFSLYGRGADWPFGYDELRPYYDRIQEEVGISGDHEKEVWRPPGAPYPMPALMILRQAEVLAEGFSRLGMRTAPMPLAINSEPYKDRAACIYDGWCDTGCPIGALADPLATYLPQAVAAGATLRSGCTVTRILTDPAGRRAVGVEYVDAKGATHIQRAAVVILAGNPIANARLILNSRGGGHDGGLSNRNDLVGRYFMAHGGVRLAALFDEDLQSYMGVTGGALISQESYQKDMAGKPFGSMTWSIANASKPMAAAGLDGQAFGQALHDLVRVGASHVGSMVSITEQLPAAENRITLGQDKDAFGHPIARTEHTASDLDKAWAAHTRAEGEKVLAAAGSQRVIARPGIAWQHYAGGTRMGTNPATSVCNGYGQLHETPNVFVAGSGLFPTEGAAHPTFTLMALALRTGDYIKAQWSGLA